MLTSYSQTELDPQSRVYVHIDNVSNHLKHAESQEKVIPAGSVPEYQNIIILEGSLRLLNPHDNYKHVLQRVLNATEEDLTASIDGYTGYRRENGKFTIFPVVKGGKFNPYMKYRSNQASASRRLNVLDNISRLVEDQIHLMNFTMTLPKEITDLLNVRKDGVTILKKFTDKFLIQLPSCLSIRNKRNSQLQIGAFYNMHLWSSSNPLEPHYHSHVSLVNYAYDRKRNLFYRITPLLTKINMKKIKALWFEIVKQEFPEEMSKYSADNINFNYHYKKGYKADMRKPKFPNSTKIDLKRYPEEIHAYKKSYSAWKGNERNRMGVFHSLRYSTRSFLYDLGKHFTDGYTPSDRKQYRSYFSFMEKQVSNMNEKGAIQNRTYVRGFMRNLKNISRKMEKYQLLYMREKDVLTRRCPATAGIMDRDGKRQLDLERLGEIHVYQIHKGGLLPVGIVNLQKNKGVVLE